MEVSAIYSGLLEMGISKGFASQLARGVRRPGLPLALRIHRAIGAKLGPIKGASKAEIAALERVTDRAA